MLPRLRSLAVPLSYALLALAAPVAASLAEDASGGAVSYQFDGGTTHDAPGMCAQSHPAWNVTLGSSTDGMLAVPDDWSDVYVLDVPASHVGSRVVVRAREAPGTPDIAVNAWAPGCLGDVFALVNTPHAQPAPPPPASGEQQASVGNLADPWRCSERSWTFVISDVRGAAVPASIHVAWTNGEERTVPLLAADFGWAAYRSTEDLDILLKGAWANVPLGWEGTFALALGNCEAHHGGAVYGEPASLTNGRLYFTPVRAGPHVIQLSVAKPTVPTSVAVPLSCHACIGEVEEAAELVSYVLDALSTPSTAVA